MSSAYDKWVQSWEPVTVRLKDYGTYLEPMDTDSRMVLWNTTQLHSVPWSRYEEVLKAVSELGYCVGIVGSCLGE